MTADVMSMSNDEQSYTISVIIPAYNAKEYVGRAIDSVLAQTRPADEIIVVDDGSTDNTAEVIKSYGSKVCFIHQENGGASVARNTGIEAATGQWIAFLDADDEWLSEKLQLQIEHLKRNSDLVWTHSNYFMHTAAESKQRLAFSPAKYERLLRQGDCFEDYLTVYPAFCIRTSTAVVRKSVLRQTGLFRVGQLWAQDTDMFLRIAYTNPKIGFLPEPLAVYYADIPGCVTLKNKGRITQRCDFLDRHLAIADRQGRLNDFESCARAVLANWIRSILASDPTADLTQIAERFAGLLPRALKTEIRLRMKYPRLAPKVLRAYFMIKNTLRSAGVITRTGR